MGRVPARWCDGRRSRAPGGRCIRHAEATPRAVDPLAVPVIEPAFQAALMRGGRAPSLVPLRGRAADRPTVGLPPPAGPTEGEHRPAPRPAAAHRAPPLGSGAHAGPRHRRRRGRRRRGGTGETDRPAGEDGGARPGGLRSRGHGSRRPRDRTSTRPSGRTAVGGKISARAGVASGHGAPPGLGRDRQPAWGTPPRDATPRVARAGAETGPAPRRPSPPARGAGARAAGAPAPVRAQVPVRARVRTLPRGCTQTDRPAGTCRAAVCSALLVTPSPATHCADRWTGRRPRVSACRRQVLGGSVVSGGPFPRSCYHCTVARPSTRWSVPAPGSCIWNSALSRRSASTPICRFSRPCSRTPTP